jgi:cellobiose phosphorylase
MFSNAYGQFDSTGSVFTITDPLTPTPWVNVVSNGRYGFVISQNGGGFSWLDNSQLNVLTRWEMDLIRDDHGRFLYLADLDSEEVWSLAPSPCRPKYQAYSCAHTQGSTTFTTEFSGIRAVWTLAVAPDETAEVWVVHLTNTGAGPRRLRIASFFEWCCGVAPDAKREFHRLFFTTRHDAGRCAVIATKNMWDVPPRHEGEHWNRPWPYAAAHAVGGVTFDRELAMADKAAFLGRYGCPARPAAMLDSEATTPHPEAFGRFVDAAASVGGDLTLPAGGTARLCFTTAIAPSEAEVLTLLDRYTRVEVAEATVNAARSKWDAILAASTVRTQAKDFDLLCNRWLPYQAISGRLWARTGYYQQSGAFGFRDQLQDSQVWLTLDPAKCLEQIMLHAAHQFADGSVYHWWHPLTETGLRTACSDDYLWLPFIVAAYVRETGDVGCLERVAPFVDDTAPAAIFEHCRRSIARALARLSPRGLPHIGSCDWNDGLSAVGVLERGESVWLAFFLSQVLRDFAELCRRNGDATAAEEYDQFRLRLLAAVNEHAWGGEYFRGATLDSGEWIGSAECEAGRIFLNCQTWAVLTDAAPRQRLESAWDAVKQNLLSDWGPLLLTPAYVEPRADIGYITRYSPGSRENGGVYMHAATWALAAACRMRDTESVRRIWASISPPLRCANAEAYRAEPYVTPGNVDGPLSETPGKAGWTWYTGSAAWLRKVAQDWVLGVRADWEGLVIDPCPAPDLGRVDFTRLWRGRQIRVRFDAKQFDPRLAASISINGVRLAENVIRDSDLPASGPIDVEVEWSLERVVPNTIASRRIKV